LFKKLMRRDQFGDLGVDVRIGPNIKKDLEK
jgi:hypothetical protein